jgi:hypothetical protein
VSLNIEVPIGGGASVTAAQIEATFTAANQIYKGTGAGTGAQQDFGTVLNFQFGAAGQLFAGTGLGTGEKLAIGTAGQVLTVGGADPSGLEWSNPTNDALQYNDLLGWTFDPALMASPLGDPAGAPVAANVYVGRIPLPAAMTVTNVLCWVITLGVTLTHSFLALFKSDGTIIGQTADQSTAWEAGGATGLYKLPLAGGPYPCSPLAANDFFWAGLYMGTSGTSADFAVAANDLGLSLNAGTGTNRLRCGAIGQANTGTLASISPAGIGNNNHLFWFAIS